ncbi:MAG: reductive dehalogenase [Dehalococcoidales bacterium]|nr:reductive dehalogenase [Dehalococcoidales bacterium]MDP7525123.1 reductive dehalogenase [Dehalococcoidales bacterium]
MVSRNGYSKILAAKLQLGPYPMEKLKRVDKPTILITDEIERVVQREANPSRGQGDNSGPPASSRPRFTGSTPSISRALMGSLSMIARGQGMPPATSMAGVPSMPPGENEGASLASGPAGMSQVSALMSGEPALEKAELPDDPAVLSRHIKSMGYFVGADIVGICELPRWAVYSQDTQGNPIECDHKYAICIVVDQGRDTMDASDGNDWISGAQSGRGYAMCGFMGSVMANYIRMMGYPARLNYLRDYQVAVPPLLMLSGIGEISRANIVLNPFLGLRFKASVITTDLPLEPDKPVDFGLQDFCDKCMKCAVECPSRSISTGKKVIRNGYQNWEFNHETCKKYRFNNPKGVACGKCIKVCPWNKAKGWTHNFVRWTVGHAPYMNDFLIKMDQVWGYGRPALDKKWWFDPRRAE